MLLLTVWPAMPTVKPQVCWLLLTCRFHCTTCTQRFNLCETCWDAMTQGGAPLHPAGHSFEHIGPRMTRHNDYYGSSGSGADAWGRQARPIPGRSWARLKERTGVSTWG
jgi:hypothetical protein